MMFYGHPRYCNCSMCQLMHDIRKIGVDNRWKSIIPALKDRYHYWDRACGDEGDNTLAAMMRHEVWKCVCIALDVMDEPDWEVIPVNAGSKPSGTLKAGEVRRCGDGVIDEDGNPDD